MSTLEIRIEPQAVDVSFTPDALRVVLADGREVSTPLGIKVEIKDKKNRGDSRPQFGTGTKSSTRPRR